MKTIKTFVPALLLLAGGCSAGMLTVANSDFSAVPVSCATLYAYQPLTAGANCNGPVAPQQDFNADPAAGWTFVAGSGLTGPSTAFNPPDFGGLFPQAAFLQSAGASVSQAINGFDAANRYTVSFYLGSRYNNSNDGNQTVDVTLDGNLLAKYALSSFTPFTLETTDAFSVTSGTHTLSFKGTVDGDHTAFLSGVSVTGTPEPATSGLIAAGMVGLALFSRRKRAA